jgi:type VI secretion system protein ImpH
MADADRRAPPRLSQILGAEPRRLDLFQALRLVEAAHAQQPRLGSALRGAADPVRLSQAPELAFPTSSIADVVPSRGGAPDKLRLLALGLFGPMGPLPLHLTAWAMGLRDRRSGDAQVGDANERVDDPAFADFCDMLQHRALALYYRAWAAARPHVQQDRPGQDRFSLYLGAICGLALPGLRDRDAVPDDVKRRFAALLGAQSASPSRLRRLLEYLLGVPVQIEELVGTWLDLPGRLWTRLSSGTRAPRLGHDAIVGVRSFQRQYRFRIRLGPMPLATYEALLPGGALRSVLVDAVRTTVDESLDWDARLVLRREETPKLHLNGRARLGWTSWLPAARRPADPADLVLRGGRIAA